MRRNILIIAALLAVTLLHGQQSQQLYPARIGKLYELQIPIALTRMGSAPIIYQVRAGSTLPSGLEIDSHSGVLSGTPTGSPQAYTFSLDLKDASGVILGGNDFA